MRSTEPNHYLFKSAIFDHFLANVPLFRFKKNITDNQKKKKNNFACKNIMQNITCKQLFCMLFFGHVDR